MFFPFHFSLSTHVVAPWIYVLTLLEGTYPMDGNCKLALVQLGPSQPVTSFNTVALE